MSVLVPFAKRHRLDSVPSSRDPVLLTAAMVPSALPGLRMAAQPVLTRKAELFPILIDSLALSLIESQLTASLMRMTSSYLPNRLNDSSRDWMVWLMASPTPVWSSTPPSKEKSACLRLCEVSIGGSVLRSMDTFKYLGVPFSYQGKVTVSYYSVLYNMLLWVTKTPLKPQQRLPLLKRHCV
ncbi:unnamed protein product, partial [Dibothriocephalus latus]